MLYYLIAATIATLFQYLVTDWHGMEIHGILNFEFFVVAILAIRLPLKHHIGIFIGAVISLCSFLTDWNHVLFATFDFNLYALFKLASFYWWGPIFFVIIPLLQIGISFHFLRKAPRLKWTTMGIAMLLIIAFHCTISRFQQRQTILEFPIANAIQAKLSHVPPIVVEDIPLDSNVYKTFSVLDQRSAVETYLDTGRSNVLILVESWGVPKNPGILKTELNYFARGHITQAGILRRDSRHTQTSENYDYNIHLPSATTYKNNAQDTLWIPRIYHDHYGFDTWYVHGYDSTFYDRYQYLHRIGFTHTRFKGNIQGDICVNGLSGICDKDLISLMDSILSDSPSSRKFIAWTTLDSHLPIVETGINGAIPFPCEAFQLDAHTCAYHTIISRTLQGILRLAEKHPEVRFIIQGDHSPLLGIWREFHLSFYYKWIPFVILN